MHSSHSTMTDYLADIDSLPLDKKWNKFLDSVPELEVSKLQFILFHTEIGKWWRGEVNWESFPITLAETILLFKKVLISKANNKHGVMEALWYASDKLRAYYIYGLAGKNRLKPEDILSNFLAILVSENQAIIQEMWEKCPYLRDIVFRLENEKLDGLFSLIINYASYAKNNNLPIEFFNSLSKEQLTYLSNLIKKSQSSLKSLLGFELDEKYLSLPQCVSIESSEFEPIFEEISKDKSIRALLRHHLYNGVVMPSIFL